MKLTPRLQQIAELVINDLTVADIGSDHAYIPIYLIEENIVPFAIASDVNAGPVENGRRAVEEAGFSDRIKMVLSNGLEGIEIGEADQVIIAGMGGMLINTILEAGKTKAQTMKRLILQPMNEQGKLRMYLKENGYVVVDERLSREGEKLYEIIVAIYDPEVEYDIDPEIGRFLLKENDELSKEFLRRKIMTLKKIIGNISNFGNEESKKRVPELRNQLESYEERMTWL